MRNAGLDEAQAGIKIARRNINNLRYADDTTLMAESEEELKSLLLKVKEESEKVGLKLSIQKMKIMASGLITSWEIDGEILETVSDFIFWGSKITADDDCSHEIKRCLLLGTKVITNLDSILKSRDITLPTKVRLVKAMVFPVVMYGCESQTVMKAKHRRIDAFELWCWKRLWRIPWTARRSNPSILKEIDRSWVFTGRTDAKAETPILWPPHVKSWLTGKDSDAGRNWGQEEKGKTEDEMAGWHHRLDGHECEWTPGVGDGQGGLVCCDSWGCKESDTTEWLNWTELNVLLSEIEITDQQDPAVVQLLGWVKWKRCYLTIFLMFGSGTASVGRETGCAWEPEGSPLLWATEHIFSPRALSWNFPKSTKNVCNDVPAQEPGADYSTWGL